MNETSKFVQSPNFGQPPVKVIYLIILPNKTTYRTSDGVSLNESCEVVHEDLCQASADLIEISLGAQRQDLAGQFESEGKNEFGCSLPPLP